jgi:hypothetical protein
MDGWRALGCAILLRAWRDAAHGNGHSSEARAFLESDGAAWLIALLDLDSQIMDNIRAELPPVLWVQLALALEA